jgi:hypothetical protein
MNKINSLGIIIKINEYHSTVKNKIYYKTNGSKKYLFKISIEIKYPLT